MKERKYPELSALKGRMREKKKTYRGLSAKMGVSTNTLNDKLNGYSVLNIDQVDFFVNELHISEEDIVRYFFPHLLRNATNDDGKTDAKEVV